MSKVDVGDQAPEFELPGTGGRTYRLSDHRGSWVILAFYPGDFTLVCTRQFCSYRDGNDRLEDLGAEVLGISPQSVDSHERFTREHGLTVPLLADEDREVIRAYGVSAPGGLVRRSIFIVDPDGVIRYRHVAVLGLRYKDVASLGEALASLR
jgi:peroxiredoxin Q/BCP